MMPKPKTDAEIAVMAMLLTLEATEKLRGEVASLADAPAKMREKALRRICLSGWMRLSPKTKNLPGVEAYVPPEHCAQTDAAYWYGLTAAEQELMQFLEGIWPAGLAKP